MIYVGSDHAGFTLKEKLKIVFDELQLPYTDIGAHSEESVDYPDVAFAVASKVAGAGNASNDLGILICGSGIGMAIAANKVKGIRAALATTEYMGSQSREHDNANILVLAGRVTPPEEAERITRAFLGATFSAEERHVRRVGKIEHYEQEHLH